MSKYRVLDDSKNKYDAEVIADLAPSTDPPTPNGFTVDFTSGQSTNPYKGNATITINSVYPNPIGQGFTPESGTNWYIMNFTSSQVEGAEDVNYTYTITFVNNTKFKVRINSLTLDEGGQNGDTITLDPVEIEGYGGNTVSGSGYGTGGIFGGWNLRLISFILARM